MNKKESIEIFAFPLWKTIATYRFSRFSPQFFQPIID
jgi:hypothetical protein